MSIPDFRSDPNYNKETDFGQDEVAILITCFIEQNKEIFLQWLAANKLSYYNGFMIWISNNRRTFGNQVTLAKTGIAPVGKPGIHNLLDL